MLDRAAGQHGGPLKGREPTAGIARRRGRLAGRFAPPVPAPLARAAHAAHAARVAVAGLGFVTPLGHTLGPFDDALFAVSISDDAVDPVAEFRAQTEAIAGSTAPGALRLLVTAESAGALVAAEMLHAGLPWRAMAIGVRPLLQSIITV